MIFECRGRDCHFLAMGNGAQYTLGDQIGTLLRLFAEGGATLDMPVYTAFGEPVAEVAGGMGEPGGEAGGGMEAGGGTGVPPVTTRYGYAGAWGYGAGAWDGAPACQTWEGNQPARGGDAWNDCPSPLGTPCCDPIAELGWLHVGERYYDPAAGRFVQRDPIGIEGGPNTYLYVLAQPLSLIDPQGLAWYAWIFTPIDKAKSTKRNLEIAEKTKRACLNAIGSPCGNAAFIEWCVKNARRLGMPEFVDAAQAIINAGNVADGASLVGGPLISVLP